MTQGQVQNARRHDTSDSTAYRSIEYLVNVDVNVCGPTYVYIYIYGLCACFVVICLHTDMYTYIYIYIKHIYLHTYLLILRHVCKLITCNHVLFVSYIYALHTYKFALIYSFMYTSRGHIRRRALNQQALVKAAQKYRSIRHMLCVFCLRICMPKDAYVAYLKFNGRRSGGHGTKLHK